MNTILSIITTLCFFAIIVSTGEGEIPISNILLFDIIMFLVICLCLFTIDKRMKGGKK